MLPLPPWPGWTLCLVPTTSEILDAPGRAATFQGVSTALTSLTDLGHTCDVGSGGRGCPLPRHLHTLRELQRL